MKVLTIVFVALMLATALCQSAQAISLTNPGFETGDLTGWTTFGDINNNINVEGNDPYEGSWALKIFQGMSGANNWSGVYQDQPATPGISYVFSGYLRNGNGSGDYLQSGNTAFLKVEWKDASHNDIGGSVEYRAGQIDSSTAQDNQWLFRAFTVTAPAGTVYIRPVVIHEYLGSGYEGGSSWFDNLGVEAIPEPAALSVYGIGAILLFLVRRRLQS